MTRCLLLRWAAVAAVALAVAQFAGCQKLGHWPSNWQNPFAKSSRRYASSKVADPPLKLNSKQKADVEMAMALALEQNGQRDRAIKVYSSAIAKDGSRADAHLRLALLYDENGECKKAEEHYLAALKENPHDAQTYRNFGYSCYLQQRWEEAEANLRESLRLNPDLKKAHNNLGMLLARTQRFDEAFNEFRQAGCVPAEAHANLALVLMFEERWEDARRQFELALAADPSSQAAAKGLDTIHLLAQRGRNERRAAVEEYYARDQVSL